MDQQEQANGGPSRQSSDDLRRAVERLLERADAVEFFEEAVEEIESHTSPTYDSDEH